MVIDFWGLCPKTLRRWQKGQLSTIIGGTSKTQGCTPAYLDTWDDRVLKPKDGTNTGIIWALLLLIASAAAVEGTQITTKCLQVRSRENEEST